MELFTYLLKVSACSALFFAFYLVVLRKLTFFKANRFYLLFSLLLSFLIPALRIEIEKVVPVSSAVQPVTVQNIQPVALGQPVIIPPVEQGINWSLWLVALYACVVLVLMALALWRLTKLLQHARSYTEHVDGLKLVYKSKGFTNCSFFNYVFIDHEHLTGQELQLLLRHEEVHAKQYHSVDKLLMLVAKTVLWFNPIIYFYDRELEQIHEYEADASASQNFGTQPYASLLLRLAIQEHSDALVHNFVKSPIKERIKKLYQSKSKNMKKLSYVLALPIATGLVWGLAINVVYAQEKVVEIRSKTTNEVPVVKVQGVKTENITSTGRVVERKADGRKTVAGIEVTGANNVTVAGVGTIGSTTIAGREVKTTNISSTYVPSEVATIVNARGANISGTVAEVRVVGVARGENVQVARNLTGTVVSGTEIASRNVARGIEGTGRSINGDAVEVSDVRINAVAGIGSSVAGRNLQTTVRTTGTGRTINGQAITIQESGPYYQRYSQVGDDGKEQDIVLLKTAFGSSASASVPKDGKVMIYVNGVAYSEGQAQSLSKSMIEKCNTVSVVEKESADFAKYYPNLVGKYDAVLELKITKK